MLRHLRTLKRFGSKTHGLHFMKTIGHSRAGKIYKARDDVTGELYTCKILPQGLQARREVCILKKLRGERIQSFRRVTGNDIIHILTDYIPGRDLFDELTFRTAEGSLSLEIKMTFIREIIACVSQVHANGFAHLDIKLENFIVDKSNHLSVKIIDFGGSHPLPIGTRKLQILTGTFGYASPELCQGCYHSNSDVWSLGVCIWSILHGSMPFHHKDFEPNTCHREEAKGRFVFPTALHVQQTASLPGDPLDLFTAIFKPVAAERISLTELEQHSWITG